MKKYFAQLRPLERRLAVGVVVVVFLVLNAWLVWPHHSDWENLKARQQNAHASLQLYQTTIAQSVNYEKLVKEFEGQGEFVAPEDQAINMMRTIQSQSAQSGVSIVNYSRSMTHTNEFFTEQTQNINVFANDAQLVDFLYKLGNGASMSRVIDLELEPDGTRMHLIGNIRLVASYQKNPKATANNLKSTNATAP